MDNKEKIKGLRERASQIGNAFETVDGKRFRCYSVLTKTDGKRAVHFRWEVDQKRVSIREVCKMFGLEQKELK